LLNRQIAKVVESPKDPNTTEIATAMTSSNMAKVKQSHTSSPVEKRAILSGPITPRTTILDFFKEK
jgi:hypothetical protein